MRRALFIALILIGFSTQGKIKFIEVMEIATWEEILQLAKASQKNLLVYIEAYPCPECKTLKKTTFKNKELARYVNKNMVAVRVPNYSSVGVGFINLYNIEIAPQLLVLNTEEDLFYKHGGLIEPGELLTQLEITEDRIKNYGAWKMAFANGKIKKLDWINYLLVEHANGRLEIDRMNKYKKHREFSAKKTLISLWFNSLS